MERQEYLSGAAFVTFENQKIVQVLIEQWGVRYHRHLLYILMGQHYSGYLKYHSNSILIH